MTKEVEISKLPLDPIAVGLGELYVSNTPNIVLAAFALGSCIALCASDPKVKAGALAHIVLPNTPPASRFNGNVNANSNLSPGKYADRALPEMIARLEQLGASRSRLEFKLVGGAAVLSGSNLLGGANNPLPGRLDIGRRNVQGILAALHQAGFAPVAADLGGPSGRTVFFWPNNGKMRVRTLRGEEREY